MKEENILSVMHCVPVLKANGFDTPNLPYELWNFTDSGWGARVEVDFSKNEQKEVTLARCDPSARKILAVKGSVVGCQSPSYPCSPRVDIEVASAREVIHEQANFGNHLAMVYGDHIPMLEKLAPLIGFEVVKV